MHAFSLCIFVKFPPTHPRLKKKQQQLYKVHIIMFDPIESKNSDHILSFRMWSKESKSNLVFDKIFAIY